MNIITLCLGLQAASVMVTASTIYRQTGRVRETRPRTTASSAEETVQTLMANFNPLIAHIRKANKELSTDSREGVDHKLYTKWPPSEARPGPGPVSRPRPVKRPARPARPPNRKPNQAKLEYLQKKFGWKRKRKRPVKYSYGFDAKVNTIGHDDDGFGPGLVEHDPMSLYNKFTLSELAVVSPDQLLIRSSAPITPAQGGQQQLQRPQQQQQQHQELQLPPQDQTRSSTASIPKEDVEPMHLALPQGEQSLGGPIRPMSPSVNLPNDNGQVQAIGSVFHVLRRNSKKPKSTTTTTTTTPPSTTPFSSPVVVSATLKPVMSSSTAPTINVNAAAAELYLTDDKTDFGDQDVKPLELDSFVTLPAGVRFALFKKTLSYLPGALARIAMLSVRDAMNFVTKVAAKS